MASLTPGVLLKLLQHASNKEVKVVGEHRSALLQVIEIVPSLAGGDDPWQSRGFFLKVSDSLHSAYVSISDEDVDLIFSDKIQLGQFVHVARLDSGSPVPVLRGVKPVPKRRPCVGSPKDLVSSDLLPLRTNVCFSEVIKGSGNAKNVKKDGIKRSDLKLKVKRLEFGDAKPRRASLGNANVEGLELRRLSLDTMRKSWDRSPGSKKAVRSPSTLKPKETSSPSDSASVLSDKKDSSKRDSLLKVQNLNKSPLKSKGKGFSLKLGSMPLKKEIKSKDGTVPCHLVKVPIASKSCSDKNISWEMLPSRIHALGKDVVLHRNASFLAAVDALQEASAAESVIRCMSMFVELWETGQQDSPGLLVGQFLGLHDSMRQVASTVDALLETRSPETKTSTPGTEQIPTPEICRSSTNKNEDATLWVRAALETDLSKFSLFTKQDKRGTINGEQYHYVVLEKTPEPTEVKLKRCSPQNKRSPKLPDLASKSLPCHSSRPRVSATKKANVERREWSKGIGLMEVASLVKRLISFSRGSFLKYLEDSLDKGFGLKRGEGDDEIAILLGQLKRVNQWLEDSVGDGLDINERIEGLKKKLYAFLLEHVDLGVVPSKQGPS
ncbi:PREDICTED: uncharacterized protein LOC104611119 [Nelumbo nucifera]|uniref:Uncharacterized protein LOC104611119 n=2 Tax=Nelumbo nucifera TaxID=4432 RepID=A0A1U8B9J3_NELNU|nr:PREDICTED: uncharacterized protein LOC104611119 [Nelumbo nucifera]DAD30131.1 TPA_asm: hypothetical protein HUJ06_031599 [Nelumbo nucifera]